MAKVMGAIVRFIVSAIVLMVVGMLVPGFSRLSFTSALIAAVIIAVMGWVIELLFGRRVSPYSRGIIGFISSVVVIYLAQLFVPGMRVTLFGAILGVVGDRFDRPLRTGDVKGNVMGGRRGTSERLRDRND